ncbi:MAG TPA: hypothetical protein VIJ93_11990, partial [bacterium]
MQNLSPGVCLFMKSLFWENRFKFVVLFWMITGSAFAQTYTWKNVTIPAGGFVCQTEFSPVQSGLIYARTDIGGVYRWDNTNSVWVPLVDQFSNSNYNYYGGE